MDEDKLLGIAKTNRTTERTYSSHRIDYDSSDGIAELVTVEQEDEDGDLVDVSLADSDEDIGSYFDGALKNPPEGYRGHEAQGNYTDDNGTEVFYKRKVLVENDTTRDEVESVLTDAGVEYEVEDVAPTAEEKEYIEDYGAESSLEGKSAMSWKRQLEDLEAGNISQVDVERGRNPHRNEHPGRPKSNPEKDN